MAIFGLKIYLFAYNSKTSWRVKLKFVHNVGTYKWFMQAEFGGARLRDQNVTGKQWTILYRYISVNTDFDGK